MVSLEEVKMFAINAHEGQVRKFTGEPYVEHCYAVAANVFEYMAVPNPDMVKAAYLHDTVEDTDVTMEDIVQRFGDTVAEAVWYLTKPESYVGNRSQRKALDRARLGLAPPEVRMVKICDLMHNAPSIKKYDKPLWSTWRIEALELLGAMDARYTWDNLCDQSKKDVYETFIEELLDA